MDLTSVREARNQLLKITSMPSGIQSSRFATTRATEIDAIPEGYIAIVDNMNKKSYTRMPFEVFRQMLVLYRKELGDKQADSLLKKALSKDREIYTSNKKFLSVVKRQGIRYVEADPPPVPRPRPAPVRRAPAPAPAPPPRDPIQSAIEDYFNGSLENVKLSALKILVDNGSITQKTSNRLAKMKIDLQKSKKKAKPPPEPEPEPEPEPAPTDNPLSDIENYGADDRRKLDELFKKRGEQGEVEPIVFDEEENRFSKQNVGDNRWYLAIIDREDSFDFQHSGYNTDEEEEEEKDGRKPNLLVFARPGRGGLILSRIFTMSPETIASFGGDTNAEYLSDGHEVAFIPWDRVKEETEDDVMGEDGSSGFGGARSDEIVELGSVSPLAEDKGWEDFHEFTFSEEQLEPYLLPAFKEEEDLEEEMPDDFVEFFIDHYPDAPIDPSDVSDMNKIKDLYEAAELLGVRIDKKQYKGKAGVLPLIQLLLDYLDENYYVANTFGDD